MNDKSDNKTIIYLKKPKSITKTVDLFILHVLSQVKRGVIIKFALQYKIGM